MIAPAAAPALCRYAGCPRLSAARGLCKMHHHRFTRAGTLELWALPSARPRSVGCAWPGCDGEHAARGWCLRHYLVEYRAGAFTPGVRSDPETPDPDEITSPDEQAEVMARIRAMAAGRGR